MRFRKYRGASINTMIAGIGETGRILRQQIETDKDNMVKPVCLFAWGDQRKIGEQNGLPVLTEPEQLPEAFKKLSFKVQSLKKRSFRAS